MKQNHFTSLAAAFACLATILPPGALAAHPEQPALRTTDVALRTGGLLVGQIVDQQGAPKAGAVIAIPLAFADDWSSGS